MKALDLDVLSMIVAVADTGNISRAAELVHRSQSAVSMQIKTLETALGKELFVRKPRSVVPTQDGEVLRSNARWLSDHGNTRVQVEGHTDERGSEEYNLALGAKRAQAAKDYLTTLGVSSDRISTISYGKELPLCTEHDDDCWAQNRRDHFVVQGSQ